jgi:hypothetical protein
MIKWDQWLTMRNDEEGRYTLFFEMFILHVVGAPVFRNKVTVALVSNFVTISDEAFALLVLENCEERWKLMRETTATKCKKANKYTDGGTSVKSGKSKTFSGWSNKGLNRFNALFMMVKNDRERRDNGFEGRFLERMKEKYPKRKRKRVVVAENLDDGEPVCTVILDDMDMVPV